MIDNKKENNEEQPDANEAKSTVAKKTQTKKKTKRKARAKKAVKIEEKKQLDELPEILKEQAADNKPIESKSRLFIVLFIIIVFILITILFPLDGPEENQEAASKEITSLENNTNLTTESVVEDVVDDVVVIEETRENETIALGKGWAITEQADGNLILEYSQEDLTSGSNEDVDLKQLREKLTPHGWGVWSDAEGGIIMVPGGARDIPAILQTAESITSDVDELRKQLTPHGWGVWPDGEGGVILIPGMSASHAP
jgi:hypothetical protein